MPRIGPALIYLEKLHDPMTWQGHTNAICIFFDRSHGVHPMTVSKLELKTIVGCIIIIDHMYEANIDMWMNMRKSKKFVSVSRSIIILQFTVWLFVPRVFGVSSEFSSFSNSINLLEWEYIDRQNNKIYVTTLFIN